MCWTKQQAVIEKFNLCEDNLSGLLKWIGQIEQKIASVGGPKEYIDDLRNQINLLKVKISDCSLCRSLFAHSISISCVSLFFCILQLQQIKEEIDGQSRPVASCLEQVRQLVLTGGDVLSAPEVSSLENSGRELRSRVDRAQDRTSKLLKKLGGARDELGKLR